MSPVFAGLFALIIWALPLPRFRAWTRVGLSAISFLLLMAKKDAAAIPNAMCNFNLKSQH